jgi:hypothetical protein
VAARREGLRLRATRAAWVQLVGAVRGQRLLRRLVLGGAWRQLQRGLHHLRVEQGIVTRMANMKRNQAWVRPLGGSRFTCVCYTRTPVRL